MRNHLLDRPIDSPLESLSIEQLSIKHATLVVFPAYYYPEGSDLQCWNIAIDGLATRPGNDGNLRSRWSISMMGRLMRATAEDLTEPLFRGRVAPFLAKGLKRLPIDVLLGRHRFRLERKTNRSGLFKGRMQFSATRLCDLLELPYDDAQHAGQVLLNLPGGLPLTVDAQHEGLPPQSQHALCVGWSGWSIVSDIDDTIKDSQVAPLRLLLANTFLNEFRSVSGMSILYQQWAQRGAQFHYVSSSPWQLFVPIRKLCSEDQFPDGTFHLRSFRLSQDLLRKMLIFRQRGKAAVIGSLLGMFRQRKFLLVGDSGEHDPEIYSRLARQFPEQIKGIFIRDLDHRRMTVRRLRKLNDGLTPGLCQAFSDSQQLAQLAAPVLDPS